MSIAVALTLAAGLAAAGAVLRWLTWHGAAGATLIGATILATTGLAGGTLLALFFVSASLLTYTFPSRTPVVDVNAGPRTWQQVLANGGWAAFGSAVAVVAPSAGWTILIGALAAAQADTWGTEVGRVSRTAPRLITSWRPVPIGTSGGITPLGTAAGIVGAVLMAWLGFAVGAPTAAAWWGAAGGVAGTFTDSLLGAAVQATYHCERCDAVTERRLHRCGTTTALVAGHRWISNDVVNAVATGVAAGVALGGWALAAH